MSGLCGRVPRDRVSRRAFVTKRCQAPNLLTNFISLSVLTTQPIRIDTVHHPINANSPGPSLAAGATPYPLESARAAFSRSRPDYRTFVTAVNQLCLLPHRPLRASPGSRVGRVYLLRKPASTLSHCARRYTADGLVFPVSSEPECFSYRADRCASLVLCDVLFSLGALTSTRSAVCT